MNTDIILKEKLNRKGLNLHTLSERSGVAYSTVYNLFTGKKKIEDAKSESLYKIARCLDMSMGDLYYQFVIREMDKAKVMPDFMLMWEDEVIGSVHIGELEVTIDRYDLNPVKQIFYADKISRFVFGRIIRDRCWDEHRPDSQRMLQILGLEEYNPFEICKKTHGKMVQDKTWFKFEGETLTYKELTRAKHAS
ncbi:helix-turn-helix domain-containing protein [Butyrivibrio sp. VCD2006]|uniref:helix-turn-helix domain-containing protein n=1 Tax=Butyrivibrio sp. VCD2006 TaxID=1280664 RepID=UPI00041D2BD8|nr:helix-turn-helix transcriptional regulator [Butyrivibrio sp. VCD2006]